MLQHSKFILRTVGACPRSTSLDHVTQALEVAPRLRAVRFCGACVGSHGGYFMVHCLWSLQGAGGGWVQVFDDISDFFCLRSSWDQGGL